MEKWNSRKAGELGMNPELLSAINVVVKRGREGLTRLHESHIQIDGFRQALRNAGLNLFEIVEYEHYGQHGETPSLLPMPWGYPEELTLRGHPSLHLDRELIENSKFHRPREGVFVLLAHNADDAMERIAACHRHRLQHSGGTNYALALLWAEDLMMKLPETTTEFDLSTSDGVRRFTTYARHQLNHNFFDSEKIEEQVESLSLELVQEDSPEWIELTRTMVSDFFRNGTAGPEIRPDKTEFGWSFVTALFPDLEGDALARRMFSAMVQEKADNRG